MSIEFLKFKQLQEWTLGSPPLEDQELIQKIKQTYLECQQALESSATFEGEQATRRAEWVEQSAIMEQFLSSALAKNIFPHFEFSLEKAQAQLRAQEENRGFTLLPRILQMAGNDEELLKKCLSLLPLFPDRFSFILDLLARDPPFGRALITFLLTLKQPASFLEYLAKVYGGKSIDIPTLEKLILDIGFNEVFRSPYVGSLSDLVRLYPKDPIFVKKFLIKNLKGMNILLEIARLSLPLASKLTDLFLHYTPDLREVCASLLEGTRAMVWDEEGMGQFELNIQSITKILPFFEWVAKQCVLGVNQDELTPIIQKARDFLSANDSIATILLSAPEEKQYLWQKVCTRTSTLRELKLADVEKIFREELEEILFLEWFEPWNGKMWISTLSALPPEITSLLSAWIDRLPPEAPHLSWEQKLTLLPIEFRKILVQLATLAEKEPQVLQPFFIFATKHPTNALVLSQLLDLIMFSPRVGERIVQLVSASPDLLKLLHKLKTSREKRYERFISVIGDLDLLASEFILSKGWEKIDALTALARTKPILLAALVEIDGLVTVDSTAYLMEAPDEESIELLLHNASFRHKLLCETSDIWGESWSRPFPFSLVVRALKHNSALTLEIVSLAGEHSRLVERLLEELLVKKEADRPFYALLLELKKEAKGEKDEKNLKRLLELPEEKQTLAYALLEIVSAQGFDLLSPLLDLAENDHAILTEIIKIFPHSPLKERIFSLASKSTLPLLKALMRLDQTKYTSFFQKVVEDKTPHTPSPALQIELLKIYFPTFSSSLEAWGEKLFTLYGREGPPPRGEELFSQLPQEVRDLLFHVAFISTSQPKMISLFERCIHYFPYPSFLSKFLQASEYHFYMMSQELDFLIKHPDCAPFLVEAFTDKSFKGIGIWSEDVRSFLIRHASYLVDDLGKLTTFYFDNHFLIDQIIQNPDFQDSDKLREIIDKTKKPKITTNTTFDSLRNEYIKVFSGDLALQQHCNNLIQMGFAKEISQFVELCKNGKAPELAQALMRLVMQGEGSFLHACLKVKGSSLGDKLLLLLSEQREPNPLLRQLIIEEARGHSRVVEQLLPLLYGEGGDPLILRLLNENEGEFAESLLAKRGEYPEQINRISSIPLQKAFFYLSQIASDSVFTSCLTFCEGMDEKKSLLFLGYVHFLLVDNVPLVEGLLGQFSKDELFEKLEKEIDSALQKLDQKIAQQVADYTGDQKELAEAKTFSVLAAHFLLTSAGTLNFPLLERVKQSAFYRRQIENKTSTGEYLQALFQALQSRPSFSAKISGIKLPQAPSSPSRQLIREICDLPEGAPLQDRDAQIAVLSALLSRPRQSATIGSCFGTSILIQTHSSPENLLFVLEDYASLITHGKITRIVEKQGIHYTYDFPVRLFARDSRQVIEGEHLLVKTLEFIIASMADKAERLVEKNLGHFGSWGIVGIKLWGINYRNVLNHQEVLERDLLLQTMRETLLQTVDAFYDPLAQYEGKDVEFKQARFNLADRESHQPVGNADEYRDLLVKVVKKAEKNLESRFPEKREGIHHTFLELLNWLSGSINQEDSFLKSLTYRAGEESLLSFFAETTGAFTPRCRAIYYEELQEHGPTQNINLVGSQHEIQALVDIMNQWPQTEREIYLKNPARPSPLGIHRHAMSFLPGPLLQHMAQGKTVQEMTTPLQKAAEQMGQIVPRREQKEVILAAFLLELPENNRILIEGEMKQSPLLTEPVTLEAFAQGLLRITQLAVGGTLKMEKKWTQILEKIIFKSVPISEFLTLPIGDCNWNRGQNNIYLCYGYSPITQQCQTYVLSPDLQNMRCYEPQYLEIYSDTIIPQRAKIW